MPNEYTVLMTHKMRSVVTVVAENEEDAKSKAYKASFDDTYCWEERDTEYISCEKGCECDAEEE